MRGVAAILALLALNGCMPFSGLVYDETVAGPYRLVAVDTMEDMVLCRSIEGNSGDCVGDGLPEPTVFAAGANDRFIAFARHPRGEFTVGSGNETVSISQGPVDSTVTEYYYLIRNRNDEGGPYGNVRGPFDERDFAAETRRLGLPAFSIVIDELR